MVKVELYKKCVLNNGSKMSNFADYTAQNDYFDNYPTADKTVLEDVKFTSLASPLLLEDSLSNLFEYVYGRIIFTNQRPIYFSVNHFEIDRADKTWLYYDIDWWETYRYPTASGNNGLQIGRARLRRCSLNLSYRLYQQFRPVSKTIEKVQDLTVKYQSVNDKLNWVVVLTHSNDFDKEVVYFFQFDKTKKSPSDIILSGSGITLHEVATAWYSPFSFPASQLASLPFVTTVVNGIDGAGFSSYKCDLADLCVYLANTTAVYPVNPFMREYTISASDDNWDNEYQDIGITDIKGNIVFTYPHKPGSTLSKKMTVRLNVSMDSAVWRGSFGNIVNTCDPNTMFTIPCEPVTIFNDVAEQYAIQTRPYQEQLRKIQQREALLNSLNSVVGSGIGGGVGGAMASKGSMMGGLAGAAGGMLATEAMALVTYKVTEQINKDYQYVEDMQASVQTDDMRFSGTSLDDAMRGLTGVWVVKIRSDTPTIDAYAKEVASFGYYYDTEIADMETLLTNNTTFKVTADCEIENVPTIAQQSVRARLSAGVEFIRPVRT